MHVFMADSSIAISGQPECYYSVNSTDQCSGRLEDTDGHSDGLNHCCGASLASVIDPLNWYYSLNGAVDCEACEFFKYLTTNYIFLCV